MPVQKEFGNILNPPRVYIYIYIYIINENIIIIFGFSNKVFFFYIC